MPRGSLLYSWSRKCLGRVHLFAGSHWRTPQTKLKAPRTPKASRGDRVKPGQIWISKELPGQIETWMTAGGLSRWSRWGLHRFIWFIPKNWIAADLATWGYASCYRYRLAASLVAVQYKRVSYKTGHGQPSWWSIQEMKLVPRKIRWSCWTGKIRRKHLNRLRDDPRKGSSRIYRWEEYPLKCIWILNFRGARKEEVGTNRYEKSLDIYYFAKFLISYKRLCNMN